MKHLFLYAFAFFILTSSPAFALSLQVDGIGQLTGATGVDVGGNLYDVQFAEGTCMAVFGGCDENEDFTFQTLADAILASQALLDTVFINGASGLFDHIPRNTLGCEFGVQLGQMHVCRVSTPFMLTNGSLAVDIVLANNLSGGNVDFLSSSQPSPTLELSPVNNHTWAVWKINQTAPIPEPSTFLLLGSGVVGLAGWQYRKKLYK